MKAPVLRLSRLVLGAMIALGSRGGAPAQVRISSLPGASTLTGTELIPGVQGGSNVAITPNQIKAFSAGGGGGAGTFSSLTDTGIISGNQCLQINTSGLILGLGSACLTVAGVTGNLQYNNGGVLGGGNLSGDCATTGLAITCLATNGTSFGTFATQNYAAPPAIGGATPAAGSFTTLSASGALSLAAGQKATWNADSSICRVSVAILELGDGSCDANGNVYAASFDAGGNPNAQLSAGGLKEASTGLLGWANTAGGVNPIDTTLCRLSAGVVEVGSSSGCASSGALNAALLDLAASASGGASLNIPQGTAPASPNNGDVWTTSVGVYARIAGGTVGPFGAGLSAIANNAVLANVSGGPAAPSGLAAPSCSGTGNALQWTAGVGFTCLTPASPLKVTPANPTALSSSSAEMLGIGSTATITPAATGRLLITVSGDTYTTGTVAIEHLQLLYGTGTAPGNGAAQSGTAAGAALQAKVGAASFPAPFSITWVVTGLSLGAAYWIDLSEYNSAGSAATVEDLSVTAVEF